jgi:hypothetical protein
LQTVKKRSVLVLERISGKEWKAVEAEVGGDRIIVSRAQILKSADGALDSSSGPDFSQFANNGDVVLVSSSDTSVCRSIEVPSSSDDETRRMVALRLETELPYPVAESTWVWERQDNGGTDAGTVLVIATRTAEIAEAEEELRAKKKRCTSVELDGACLAELAVACTASADTVALVSVLGKRATLAIAHAGKLRYARRISLDTVMTDEARPGSDWVSRLANQLDQSLYDYLLRTGGEAPARILVAGDALRVDGLVDALGARLKPSVEEIALPEIVRVSESAGVGNDLLERFPECVGAMIATHHRLRGERTTAPALRRQVRRFAEINLRNKRVALICASAVLLVELIVMAFVVQGAQLKAAGRAIDESRPLLQDVSRLEDEVDILQYEGRRQRAVLDALIPITEALPKDIKVETLDINARGEVTIAGKTKSVEAASDKAISAMRASRLLADPRFLGATQGEGGFSFRITCKLRGSSAGR